MFQLIYLSDFSLPETNLDTGDNVFDHMKKSLIHRSQSKRDMETIASDDIPEKIYPSSCPAHFFSILNQSVPQKYLFYFI